MRKSQRQKQKHKKNNTTSRKFKGGNNDINGYVLAGFYNENIFNLDNVCLRSPIFLLKEKTLKHTLSPGLDNDPKTRPFFKRLSIPILYDLNFRGLILNSPFGNRVPYNTYFYDGEELIYPTPLGHRFKWPSSAPFIVTNDMNEEEQTKIKEIELKYPGLFTRMFITEEEEEEALEKEMQKQRIKKETEAEIDQLFL